MRSLSPEESALWARVTATIEPLSRVPAKVETPAATDDAVAPPEPAKAVRPAPPRRARPVQPPRPQPGQTLDGSWDRRLRSGSVTPDRVLDLHGHRLDGAWHAIDNTLEQAIRAGNRVVLLVTGHERPGEPPIARGKIRAAVHDWLAVSRHAAHIAAVRGAHRRHGGGGSLYVILRRRHG